MGERSYHSYVDEKIHQYRVEHKIKTTDYEMSIFIRDLIPYLICRETGHKDQPKRFLRRFAHKPWRCNRCGTWYVSCLYGTIDGAFWTWTFVGSDDNIPEGY